MLCFLKQQRLSQQLWNNLCIPLDAVAYTNEVLLVSGSIATLLILLLVSFAGNIDTMSEAIGNINEIKRDILNEKIDIISSEIVGTDAIVVLTNYGKDDAVILAFFSDLGAEITCTSNNIHSANMTVSAGRLLEITCPVSPSAEKILIVTNTRNILEVRLR